MNVFLLVLGLFLAYLGVTGKLAAVIEALKK